MSRLKTFPGSQITEVKLMMPTDKADALRSIARKNGLALTDYVRSLCFVHLARIAQTEAETKL